MYKRRFKTILAYTAGILALTAAVAVAWFLPGWYANWQDSELFGRPQVSSRDEIRFLDTDALDAASRLRMLKDFQEIVPASTNSYDATFQDEDLAVCRTMLKRWEEANLLPAGLSEYILSENLLYWNSLSAVDTADPAMRLPIQALLFGPSSFDDLSYAEDVILRKADSDTAPVYEFSALYVLVLMDAEKNLLYDVSFLGADNELVSGYAANSAGYSSVEELILADEEKRLSIQDDYSRYDFAGVCGAESASVSGSPWELNLDAVLHYETFDGIACRRLIKSNDFCDFPDTLYGFAVLFGSEGWNDFVSLLGVSEGFGQIDLTSAAEALDLSPGELSLPRQEAEMPANDSEIQERNASDQ